MLDAHVHVVDPARTVADPTGNPSGAWWRRVDARPDEVVARLRDAGVTGGVLVQAVGAHGLADCAVVLEAASAHDGFGAMVTVDPRRPVEIPDGAVGVRLFSIRDPWLAEPVALDVIRRCVERGLTPSICCLPGELPAAGRLLDAFDVAIALDHAGFVEIGRDDRVLAGRDNLVVKLSTGVFDHSALDPAATVDRLIDLVGADRVAWGSDHPQVHDRGYAELVGLAEAATAHLPDATRAAVLGGTAARLWLS